MKNILYILLAISIASCNNSKKVETAQSYAATPNGLADLQNSTAPTKTATGATSNLLTNPEHGQPGHDCSIAVGAPLKAGAKTSTPVTQQAPANVVQTASPQPTTPSTTAAGSGKLNPAHGQPGHDCAVAVGAPLSSKTAQSATNNAAPKINVSQPTTTSATPILNEKGKKLNPAHGQPGHDCAVAVGAPLS